MPQKERINLTLTEAERAEIEAAVPEGSPVGRSIVAAGENENSKTMTNERTKTTIETVTMRQLADLQARARAAGNERLAIAAVRAARGYSCGTALRRCVAAINGTSAEGQRLSKHEAP